jgi:hypothetical protein
MTERREARVPLRTMLVEFSWDDWVEVFGQLAHRGVLEPVYWSAIPPFEAAVRARFPRCEFHGSMEASRGDLPPGHTLRPPRWTRAMLKVWNDDAQDMLLMLNRADLEGAFDLQQRLDYMQHQLALADQLLDAHRPDLVLFSAPPHVGYDFVLYRLCVARGIRTLLFEWTMFGPHTFILDSLADGDLRFLAAYRARLAELPGRPVQLTPMARAYLEAQRGSHEQAAKAHYPDLNRQGFGGSVYSSDEGAPRVSLRQRVAASATDLRTAAETTWELFRDDVYRWRNDLPAKWESAFIVEKGIGYRNAVKGQFLRSRIYRKHRHWLKTAHDRRRECLKYARPVPTDAPFIFVALHQQPERTTSPQGHAFADQMKAIQLLCSAAPPGWKIVVKEHMAQLNPVSLGHMYRPLSFYSQVAAIPNAVLVSPYLPPAALIDRCAVVATVTGTVGWEAVLRGKPVFIMGEAWYRGCEGVFDVSSHEACSDAFAALSSGYRVDPIRVEAFVETIERNQTQASPQPPLLPYCTLPPEENARRLADALEARLIR